MARTKKPDSHAANGTKLTIDIVSYSRQWTKLFSADLIYNCTAKVFVLHAPPTAAYARIQKNTTNSGLPHTKLFAILLIAPSNRIDLHTSVKSNQNNELVDVVFSAVCYWQLRAFK
jgi:hypothetical protein